MTNSASSLFSVTSRALILLVVLASAWSYGCSASPGPSKRPTAPTGTPAGDPIDDITAPEGPILKAYSCSYDPEGNKCTCNIDTGCAALKASGKCQGELTPNPPPRSGASCTANPPPGANAMGEGLPSDLAVPPKHQRFACSWNNDGSLILCACAAGKGGDCNRLKASGFCGGEDIGPGEGQTEIFGCGPGWS